jgi:hypothetical protein
MFRLLADVHAGGYLATLVRICQNPPWRDFWKKMNVHPFDFAGVGLDGTVTDVDLWEFCQGNQFLLVTGNRNSHGSDSLDAAIRERNTADALPVITFANLRLFRRSRDYREQTAIRLMEILLDLDEFRGTGRLYIPNVVAS